MGVRVDQPRSDQCAAQVLDVIDVDNVVDDTRNARWQLGGEAGPGNVVILHQDDGIAQYFGTSPHTPDIGQETDHRQAPWPASVRRLSSTPSIMTAPSFIEAVNIEKP